MTLTMTLQRIGEDAWLYRNYITTPLRYVKGFKFQHIEFTGDTDRRYGTADTLQDCVDDIDELIMEYGE